jgi:hypothetical protein
MQYRNLIIIGVLLFGLLCAVPVAAITVKHLDVNVGENGDAGITADYDMNWMEQVIVYPAGLSILAVNAPDRAVIHSVSPFQAYLTVKNLVTVQHTNDSAIYTTPAFSGQDAQKVLDRFWFANMVALNFAPGTITFRFPDGATIEDTDLSSVPSFVHTVHMT